MPPVSLTLSDRILHNGQDDFVRRQKPAWLRAKLPGGPGYERLRSIIDTHQLHTVCESARCPNMGECWAQGTATVMILGDVCTRSCGFCNIKTGRPLNLDLEEPRRVGEAASLLGLRHMVVTSVNRDELADGGAEVWAQTIREIRRQSPETSVEVLIPDFCGDWDALQKVIDEKPEILNHNMETVRRMYGVVRPQAKYERSIELLRRAKEQGLTVKTGIMLGIGETDDEVVELMRDVVEGTRVKKPKAKNQKPKRPATETDSCPETSDMRHQTSDISSACDILTIGQYLQPSRDHLPVTRFVPPEQFARFKRIGEEIGFGHVESGPLVRSSYHAADQVLHLHKTC